MPARPHRHHGGRAPFSISGFVGELTVGHTWRGTRRSNAPSGGVCRADDHRQCSSLGGGRAGSRPSAGARIASCRIDGLLPASSVTVVRRSVDLPAPAAQANLMPALAARVPDTVPGLIVCSNSRNGA
jgi:hypothetical protein